MTKLRNVRRKQWERYRDHLDDLPTQADVKLPPGYWRMRWRDFIGKGCAEIPCPVEEEIVVNVNEGDGDC